MGIAIDSLAIRFDMPIMFLYIATLASCTFSHNLALPSKRRQVPRQDTAQLSGTKRDGHGAGKKRTVMLNIIKYFLVGGVSFLVDLGVFYWLAEVNGYYYLLVNVLSFSLSTITNYLLCIFFVFQSGLKYGKRTELMLVFLVSGVSLTVNQLTLYTFVDIFHLGLMISKVTSVLFTFFVNYFGRKIFVFGQTR